MDDIGFRTGLGRLHRLGPGPGQITDPAHGLPAHHRRDFGLPGGDGDQGVVDQCLLGDTQLHEMGASRPGAHPRGHQPGGIGIGPVPLGHRQPVDAGRQPRRSGVGTGGDQCPGHQLGGFGIAGCRAHPDEYRRARVEGRRTVRQTGTVHRITGSRDHWSPVTGANPVLGAGRGDASLAHHPTHLTPGHRHRPELQRLSAGPFRQVVVGAGGDGSPCAGTTPASCPVSTRRRAAPHRCRPPDGTSGRRPDPTGPVGASHRGRRSQGSGRIGAQMIRPTPPPSVTTGSPAASHASMPPATLRTS